MPTTTQTLPELKGRIDHLRGNLLRAFQEAGDSLDLSKVKVFPGTAVEKMAGIRDADRELNDLQQLVEARLDLVGTRLPAGEPKQIRMSVGERFVKSEAYLRRAAGEAGPAAELDIGPRDLAIGAKSVLTTFSAGFADYGGSGVVAQVPEAPPLLSDVVPTVTWDHWRVRYLDETAATDAAAQVAEGALYPEASVDLEEKFKRLRKVGVVLPVTTDLLEDDATAATYVDQRLSLFAREQLDGQLLNGDGTGQNLAGFHTIATGGTTYPSGGTVQQKIAAILAGAGAVATNGQAVADTVVIKAADWWAFLAAQDTTGEFLFEPGAAMQGFFGLRPVVTTRQSSGRFLVGAVQQHSILFARQGVEIQVSLEHTDRFARDVATLRARIPAWLAVLRPAAFTTVSAV